MKLYLCRYFEYEGFSLEKTTIHIIANKNDLRGTCIRNAKD
jgi:hypothetical protein